jgi:hypothetical protein
MGLVFKTKIPAGAARRWASQMYTCLSHGINPRVLVIMFEFQLLSLIIS